MLYKWDQGRSIRVNMGAPF